MTMLAEPSAPAGLRPRRLVAAGSALILGAAAAAYVRAVDPHDRSAVLPRCPIHWATGLQCPGCGGLRMAHDLMHGDVAEAFRDNAVLLMVAPLLLALLGIWGLRWVRGGRARLDPRVTGALLVVALGWFVLRNIVGW